VQETNLSRKLEKVPENFVVHKFLLSDNHLLHFKPAAIMYFCAYEDSDYKTDETPLNFWQGAFLYYILGNGC